MSDSAAAKFLFAVSLIPVDAPLTKRIDILSRHIQPKPGRVIEIDRSLESGEAITTTRPENLYGWITINPPQGQCFTVTTHRERNDIQVCKKTKLKWLLRDLDPDQATISWIIRTSAQDFGTPLTWSTPYTVARVLPSTSEFNKETAVPLFFKSCVGTLARSDGTPRKITLSMFNNKKWIFKFPDEDTPISSPTKTPSDSSNEAKSDGSPKADGHQTAGAESSHGGQQDPAKETTAQDSHGGGHGDSSATASHDSKKELVEPTEPWTMNSGRGYEMNVGNFITDGSMPPGKKGTCRYSYDYPPGKKSRGRIECHHSDQFLYVYAVVPCFQNIRLERKNK